VRFHGWVTVGPCTRDILPTDVCHAGLDTDRELEHMMREIGETNGTNIDEKLTQWTRRTDWNDSGEEKEEPEECEKERSARGTLVESSTHSGLVENEMEDISDRITKK